MKKLFYITGIMLLGTSAIMHDDSYERSKGYIQSQIYAAAKEKKINPALALAIAEVESTFNPNALREETHKNSVSVGLFQMFLPTAKDMGFKGTVEELKQVDVNIKYGVKFLAKCQKKFGNDVRKIACCHNAGLYRRQSVCENDSWVIHYQNKVEKAYIKYVPKKTKRLMTTASL